MTSPRKQEIKTGKGESASTGFHPTPREGGGQGWQGRVRGRRKKGMNEARRGNGFTARPGPSGAGVSWRSVGTPLKSPAGTTAIFSGSVQSSQRERRQGSAQKTGQRDLGFCQRRITVGKGGRGAGLWVPTEGSRGAVGVRWGGAESEKRKR